MTNNIVLVGFMGSGKTSVAKVLAKLLKKEVVATDDLIEKQEKRNINDIFCDSGEPYFRKIEKQIVRDISKRHDLIIDCGGGVVLDQENVDRLKENGTLFYLETSAKTIFARIKNQKHRPLLNVAQPQEKIEELLSQRASRYAQAHQRITTDNLSIEQIAREIIKRISHE